VTDLTRLRAFVFDLDGCVWNGDVLNPGAPELLARLHDAGRGLAFVSNNSRATGADLRGRLHRLGVTLAEHVLTPLEIIGETIAQKYGPSRVLVIGARETAEAVALGGHAILGLKDHRDATVVVVGNDFDLSYERLAVAARVAARGAPLVTPNLDPRLPIEGDDFLPGCGAIVAAVAVTAGVTPVVVGKPEPPLFRIALARIGVSASEAAMVGDSVASDMRGAHAVGMATVLYAPSFAPDVPDLPAGTVVVRSFAELGVRLGLA
jgi:4-nitrophenyl phosphatase